MIIDGFLLNVSSNMAVHGEFLIDWLMLSIYSNYSL